MMKMTIGAALAALALAACTPREGSAPANMVESNATYGDGQAK
ncbi:MAG: hypothetical protein U5M50_03910 [Sphingobium sp.]|nr:hypothetical protein [Sphingobium sp.]